MKRCSRCHELKPLEAYNKCASSPDGHDWRCRKCASEAYKIYSKTKRRYTYTTSIEVPKCNRRMKLSDVLPSLVKISSSGAKYKDEILINAVESIKESLT